MKITILLLALTLGTIGCDRTSPQSTDPNTTTTAVPAISKGMKTCFNCDGVGQAPCVAHGCKHGMVDCPGPCLKLSHGTWQHMHVDGHSDTDLWQKFPQNDGTSRAWNQGHVGDVIEMQGGKAVDVGKCRICGGTGKVKCSVCHGTGQAVCPVCDGQKVVPEGWTAFNNPKLKNPPQMLRLKDGRTIFGKIESQMGSTIYVRTESGNQEVIHAGDIISSGTNAPTK